jgi:hypothetical protein
MVAKAWDQHRRQPPGVRHDLLVEAGFRLDIEADPIPPEIVPLRPNLPLLVARHGPRRVLGGEVVAVLDRKQRGGNQGDARLVELPDNLSALLAEVGDHHNHPRPERPEVLDHRPVGEQLGQSRRIKLARESQLRSNR